MSKDDILQNLDGLESQLRAVLDSLKKIRGNTVTRQDIRKLVENISRKWFEGVETQSDRFGVHEDTLKKYHNLFHKLLSLSVKISWKTTYLKTIEEILQDFKDDIIVLVMKSAGKIVDVSHLFKVLENVSEDEKEYLTEALGCASSGFFRASIVLGWNAAVHRMHKVVEKHGFDELNQKSKEMKSITKGRFKRFNKSFNVSSRSELEATVFDNDLLWILEYWGLLVSNQHDRLSLCFTMRNNCAHPGEAPLTEENLASFYSDLKIILFDNPKFKL